MRQPAVAIIDYGLGNVRSLANALERVHALPILTRDPAVIQAAGGLILPGVGAFQAGMERLQALDLVPSIRSFFSSGKPLLGICLGMQLLMDQGEEFGISSGLGLVSGAVKRLQTDAKLPHMGWNRIRPPHPDAWQQTLLQNISPDNDMYFVHSYAVEPSQAVDILGLTDHGRSSFVSAVQHDNIVGLQFHPERSGPAGINILAAYVQSCRKIKQG